MAARDGDVDLTTLDVDHLVSIIYSDWENMNPTAAVYLSAVDAWNCKTMSDRIGNEDAAMQFRYFLSFATGWRGPTARAVKAELRRRLDAPLR